MDASAEGLTDMVQELIRRGADLSGLSRNGQNALVLAIGKGAQDIAAILLDAGADPFVADKLGMNACQYAQLLGRKEFQALVQSKFPDKA
jgi:ankyrin repeat protein